MKNLKLIMCAGAASLGMAWAGAALADDQPAPASTPPAAAPAAPAPAPAPYPSMGPVLANNPAPASFDAGFLGKLTVSGAFSGLLIGTDHPGFDFWDGKTNKSFQGDFTNGLVTVQKTDGLVQFVIQAGAYSFPTVGSGYIKGSDTPEATFGFVPVAYVKIVPNAMFSFEAGQLPTLIGAELPFTYQNANIERGLLWNAEPLISRGLQANFTSGPWAASLSVNDGFYSNEFTTISGLVTYTFKNTDTLTVAGSGNASVNFKTSFSSPFVTPIGQQQGQIYNLIFTHNMGPFVITPYLQYSTVPNDVVTGASASEWGFAVIAKYSFTPEFSLAGRAEYETTNGAYNMLFGPKSNAWSITFTPTYQKGIFFARAEVSYTSVGSGTPFSMLGPVGLDTNQTRGLLEAGFIF